MAATKKKNGAGPAAKNIAPAVRDPGRFLDLPPEASAYASARVVVLPMPLEASVSYGHGTAAGPDAIIDASRQVELYDARSRREPALDYGVHTLPPPREFADPRRRRDVPALIDGIARETAKHLSAGKFVLGLGGEHTASLGVAKGVAAGGPFTLVHIDAHADLRDSYESNPYSHACVVRRIAELPGCELVLQLGIRSTSRDQAEFAESRGNPESGARIRTWYAWDMRGGRGWKEEFRREVKGRRVFFTFDVDGLDPSVIPATGTPEPDGLSWRQLMAAAKLTARHAAEVAALDCVELAPAPGLHYAEFAAARAVYEMTTLFVDNNTDTE